MRMIGLAEVKTIMGWKSKTTVYKHIADGLFPRGIKLRENGNNRWNEEEVKSIACGNPFQP